MVSSDRTPEFPRDRIWRDLGYIFRLIGRYFRRDPAGAVVLSATYIGSGSLAAWLSVQMTLKMGGVTDKLVARDVAAVRALLVAFAAIATGYWATVVVRRILELALRIRIRNAFTAPLLDAWLLRNAFYHLDRNGAVDHPEQRIQEDVSQFAEMTVGFVDIIVSSATRVCLYAATLWTMSPPLPLDRIGIRATLPGSILLAVVVVSVIEIVIVHKAGNLVTRAELVRQRVEAGFRADMGRVRDNAEAIAFEDGGARERARMADAYGLIRRNWRHYTVANGLLRGITMLPTMTGELVPVLLAAPLVLAGTLTIGQLQVLIVAYGAVSGGLILAFIQYNSMTSIAVLRSAANRIHLLESALADRPEPGIRVVPAPGVAIGLDAVTIDFPDGAPMLAAGSPAFARGERWLVRGRSGTGKSTLLRAVAGLWPFGGGTVAQPDGARVVFLPQRGYIPDGTLAAALSYPAPAGSVDDATYLALLDRLSLGRLKTSLHDEMAWRKVLSPGEQQRVAAARAILARPDFLFLDEATSALDPALEEQLYAALIDALPDAAIVSVAHRDSVARFHTHVLDVRDGRAVAGPAFLGDHP